MICVDLLWVWFASVVFTVGLFLIHYPLNTINTMVNEVCTIYDFIHSIGESREEK